MKNKIFLLVMILALMLSLAACGGNGKSGNDSSTPGQSNASTPSEENDNLPKGFVPDSPKEQWNKEATFDIAVAQGDWIYYSAMNTTSYLHKMKKDGSEKTQISNIAISSFAVLGNWIYYFNDSVLHKMLTDGTNDTSIYNGKYSGKSLGNNLFIVGEWIYGRSGKVRTDGTEFSETPFADSASGIKSPIILVKENIIYYNLYGTIPTLNQINIDFTNQKTVMELTADDAVIDIIDGYIYLYRDDYKNTGAWSGSEHTYSILKCKLGDSISTAKTLVSESETSSRITFGHTSGNGGKSYADYGKISGNYLYYAKLTDKHGLVDDPYTTQLCRLDLNGSGENIMAEFIGNSNDAAITIAGDWIYYKNPEDGLIYRMRLDGTDKEKVS